jgi:hypothetical protein
VADFGLAKFSAGSAEATLPGQRLGTPAYMAPEQAAGHSWNVTAASDVWALGVILCELLTGQRPFPGEDGEEVLRRVLTAEPLRPRALRPDLPADLETIILKCLQKDPRQRYAAAADLAADLRRWLRGKRVVVGRASPLRRAVRLVRRFPLMSLTLLLAGLTGLAFGLLNGKADPERPLRQARDRLARGEAVTLLDDKNPPRWSQWRWTEGILQVPNQRDGAFTLESLQPALLEILRDPGERYRFSVEVRHNEARNNGEVGLFFTYSRTALAGAEHHCCLTWSFNDFTPFQAPGGGAVRKAKAELHRFSQPGGVYSLEFGHQFFAPADGAPPWRSLAVEVRPDDVRLFWDNLPVGAPIPWATIRKNFDGVCNGIRGREFVNLVPGLTPPFANRQPLGLYVHLAQASFRNAVVEPLP